jgi:ketosteroid isomerase-like protein
MSESNVELTRRAIAAFNARDIERYIAYFAPSIEYHSTFAAADGAVYHGHDGMRSWHRDLVEAWGDEIRGEPAAYFDLGQDTLVFFTLHGRGKHSGAEVAMPITTLLRWRDGLVVYFKGYALREDALRDLGVSEDELEPIEP